MDNLFLNRMNSRQGIVNKKQKNIRIGYLVSIHKLGFLFKIKACEKNNQRHIFNISRIIY
jgi:hypothetical protein